METLHLSEGHDREGAFGWTGELETEDLLVSVEIRQDIFSGGNGSRDWDNLGTMVTQHSRYVLGDEQVSDAEEWARGLAEELDPTVADRIDYWENGKGWAYLYDKYGDPQAWSESDKRINDIIQKAFDQHLAAMLPLYLYDHSGITMRVSPFSCPWDSGQVGYIYVSKATVRKEYNVKRISKKLQKRVEKYLVGEVETYDDFLTGNVWGYIVDVDGARIACETCEHESRPETVRDSCWGFYGDPRGEYGVGREVNAILEDFGVKVDF
jgi:hypothetical protein